MKLNIFSEIDDNCFINEVKQNDTLSQLKQKIYNLHNVKQGTLQIYYNDKPITDDQKTLGQYGIKSSDIILIKGQKNNQPRNMVYQDDMESFRNKAIQLLNQYKTDQDLDKLFQEDEKLAIKILQQDVESIAQLIKMRQQQNQNNHMQQNIHQQQQQIVPKKIDQNEIKKIRDHTYDIYPELFVPTEMLYIEGTINKTKVDIFVDTGAQTTFMSLDFAIRANIDQFIDKTCTTTINGVNSSQKSIGKIWQCLLQIQNKHFIISATVYKNPNIEVLLGLDMMKRYQCNIEFSKEIITFGSENVYAKFYTDHQVREMRKRKLIRYCQRIMQVLNVDQRTAENLLKENNFDLERCLKNNR